MVDRIKKVETAMGIVHNDGADSDVTLSPINSARKPPLGGGMTEDKAETMIKKIIDEKLAGLDIN